MKTQKIGMIDLENVVQTVNHIDIKNRANLSVFAGILLTIWTARFCF